MSVMSGSEEWDEKAVEGDARGAVLDHRAASAQIDVADNAEVVVSASERKINRRHNKN